MCIIRITEISLVIRTVLKQLSFLIFNNREVHYPPRHVSSVSHVAELMDKNVVKKPSSLDLRTVDRNSKRFRSIWVESSRC